MKDRKTQSDDWINEWIERQRETLAKRSSGADQPKDADPADALRRWLEAGQSLFSGAKHAGAGTEGAFTDPFNVSGSLLAAWTSAGLMQAGATQQASEFLSKVPPIGLAREQTEAWRELIAAQARCQALEGELRAMLLKVQFDALDLLQERIRERGTAEPIDDTRALYDLWVECAEQIYNKLAHSESFAKLQAELGNATMRLRSRLQTIIEHWLKQFDLPTRSEVNSLHRQMRDLRLQVEQLTSSSPEAKPSERARKRATSPAATRASRKSSTRSKKSRR